MLGEPGPSPCSTFVSGTFACNPSAAFFVHSPGQVSELVDLKTWTDDPKNNPKQKKFRNITERRKFVKDLGLNLVRHPRTGEECVPQLDKTIMLAGHRKALTRQREEKHDEKASAKQSYNKHREDYNIRTNTKD